jgi:hypothetical protein
MENRWIFRPTSVSATVRRPWAMTPVITFLVAHATSLGCGGPPPSTPPDPRTTASAEESHHGTHAYAHPHRFDDAARWSKVFDDPERDAWQKPQHVVELLGVAPGMTVADVGAATGYFLPHLAKAVGPSGKVIGEDIEPDMVKWMSDRGQREKLTTVEARLGTADDPKLVKARSIACSSSTHGTTSSSVTPSRGSSPPRSGRVVRSSSSTSRASHRTVRHPQRDCRPTSWTRISRPRGSPPRSSPKPASPPSTS